MAYVLSILHQPGETVDVGSVLFWLGASPDETIPETADVTTVVAATGFFGSRADAESRPSLI